MRHSVIAPRVGPRLVIVAPIVMVARSLSEGSLAQTLDGSGDVLFVVLSFAWAGATEGAVMGWSLGLIDGVLVDSPRAVAVAIFAVAWMSSFTILVVNGASLGWWLPLHSAVPATVLTVLGLREIRCVP